MAKKADGTIWAWGKNENGQLGNGASADSSVPVQVMGLAGIEQISAGEYHSMALRADGTVWAWGRNQYGQLGDNTRNSSSTPVQVTGENGFGYLTGVEEIAAGIGYSMALMSDGTLMAWGHNNSYQLGDGTQQSRNAPVQVLDSAGTAALAEVVEFSANGETTMAKTADGTVWIWGTNRYGEFGNGTNGSYSALPLEFGVEAEDSNYSISKTFNLQEDELITVYSSVTRRSGIGSLTFEIAFDSSDLVIDDLCAQTYEKETVSGAISNSPVTILDVQPGKISFCYADAAENGWFSGVINIFRFRALKTGDTSITFSAVQ